jgi:hypothetical protein
MKNTKILPQLNFRFKSIKKYYLIKKNKSIKILYYFFFAKLKYYITDL